MSMEIKILLEAPELAASINNLAAALGNRPAATTTTPAKNKKTEDKPKPELVEDKSAAIEDKPLATPVDETIAGIAEAGTPAEEETIYTLVQVREKLKKLSQDGKQAQVKELITKAGATKLSEIPESKYAELMKEAEAL